MTLKINGLTEVISIDRITEVLLDAFANYPMLIKAFPDKYPRHNALEASIRYYGQYDLHYGKAYTLDEDVFEVALILEASNKKAGRMKYFKAGSYSYDYQKVKERMSVEERKRRLKLYGEIKKMEKRVPMPENYLYIDYFGVVKAKQGEGRGRMLMEKICEHADREGLPIVLFVNSKKALKFFGYFDFTEITTVTSETFGLSNTYLIRDPGTE